MVTTEGSVDDLADDLGACAADDKAVLLGVVLVLVLEDHSAAGEVIGFTFAATAIFGLVARAVSAVLLTLDESHL